MPAINATIVVDSTNLTITPTTTNLGVTVEPINLGIFTTSPTPLGGSIGQLQYNATGVGLGGVANTSVANGNITFTNLANLKIAGGTNAYYLQTDGANNLTWAAGGTPTGSGVPSGANTQIQLSDGSGAFDSGAGFTFDNVSNVLSVPGNINTTGIFNGDGGGISNIQPGNIVGLSLSEIANGTSNVSIPSIDGNIDVFVNGTSQATIGSLGLEGSVRTGDLTLTGTFAPLGLNAGTISPPTFGVAIGTGAGENNLGDDSIAIGRGAGNLDQADNSIVLNATGANLTTSTANSFIVSPIRQGASSTKVLYYNDTTKEITADGITFPTPSEIVNGTSTVDISTSGANIDFTVAGSPVGQFSTTGAAYPAVLTVQGNINAFNDITAEPGAKFVGDGGLLSNLSVTSGTKITNGTSNVDIASLNGNITIGVNSVADRLIITDTGLIADGYGLSNIAGANISGAVALATSATNANGVAGANVSGAVASATTATTAGTVTTAAQPNITSVGRLSSLSTGSTTVTLGLDAGLTNQGFRGIAIGQNAGKLNQGANAIAIGRDAGSDTQTTEGIAIGQNAGSLTQGLSAVAVGTNSGQTTQGANTVAVGYKSGWDTQGEGAVAVGYEAGENDQQANAIAIGYQSGSFNQGEDSIALGKLAGNPFNQADNSIVLNATGVALNTTTTGTFNVKPVRSVLGGGLPSGFKQVAYNPTTGEFIYYD